MNPLTDDLWNRGLTYEAFRQSVRRNQEGFDEAYAEPNLRPEDLELLRRLPPLRLLAIGEDWCPDVFNTLPTWVHAVEALPGWELRVFPRDQHPELMWNFLWKKEAQRIPVYAFYDAAGRLQTWWSGRGAAAERALQEMTAGRSFGDIPADEQKRLSATFEERYRREFRRANFEEILALLRAFFHLEC
jgi:hypothetical protein